MDYITQTEKLYKFFEFTLDFDETRLMYVIKHKFNNDLNLLGCFIKDFLTIQNDGIVSNDECIYNDFVLWFEKNLNNTKKAIKEFSEYADYYLTIVFEDSDDDKIQSAVSTINACFAMDCYPNLMKIFYKFYNHKVDVNTFYMMLESIVDIVLKRFENFSCGVLNFKDLEDVIEPTELEKAVI